MKRTRCMCLLLLTSLLTAFAGCDFREVLDDYPVSGVEIKLNWKGVTEKLPDGVRVIFYPKSEEGRKVDTYLSVTGGGVKVPPGHYAVVVYNYNTESVLIRDDESYESIEAYTGYCTGLNTKEKMVWSPDPLYVVALDDVKIPKSDAVLQLEYKPQVVVKRYSFEIKVTGLHNVANIICSVSGMNGAYSLGKRSCQLSTVPVYVDTERGDGVIKGNFAGFVPSKSMTTRTDAPVMMTLTLVKVDQTVQEVKVDITQAVAPPPPPEPGQEPEEEPDVVIEVPVEEDIVVEDVDPTPGGGGGIGGDVGDWGEEDNVELPV